MEWLVLLGIPIGIVLLYFGSDWMVDGAKKLALYFGVTPFVVGLTVVAFGSSAPEAITSIVSTANPDIIIGNVVGSNIANIGLAIGLAAVISPIICSYKSIRFEIWSMIISTVVITLLALNGVVGMTEGLILIIALFLFVFLAYKFKKDQPMEEETPVEDIKNVSLLKSSILVIVGILALYIGARAFIDGSVFLAHAIGISELMTGLIIVAVGTSLPELCICILAAYRKENDLVVSNIVGSIVFNCLFVLGIGSVLVDVPISHYMLVLHMPIMIIFAIIMSVFIYKGKIGRPAGALIIGLYAAYIAAMAIWPELTQGLM